MPKNVLFVSSAEEFYYFLPFVKAASTYATTLHLLDTTSFPINGFCLRMETDGTVIGQLGVQRLDADGSPHPCMLSVSDIHAAWYLRAVQPSVAAYTHPAERQFAASELRAALATLCAALPCQWINSKPAIDRVTNNKFFQQALAASVGLSIPRTAIITQPEDAHFCASTSGHVLVKPFSQVVLTNLETHAIYSQVFDIEELSHHAPSLARCPIYTQQYVEKRFEHRAMVIGDQVLNCRMDTQASERTRIDFRRYDFAAVRHEPCALPSDIEAKLLAFMSAAELRYGAIDLIETPDGDFVFLEVNPSGQWEWISHFAGLDIPSAVARLLIT